MATEAPVLNLIAISDLPPVLQSMGLKCTSRSQAYAFLKVRDFPALRVGGRYYVERDQLKAWVLRQIVPPKERGAR